MERLNAPTVRITDAASDDTIGRGATEDTEMKELNALTERIIGCAIEVHKTLGPGLLENSYESALCVELQDHQLAFIRQPVFPASYKGHELGHYRIDLIVEDAVVVEVKSVERFDPLFAAQILTYLRVTGLRIGLVINFNSRLLTSGVRRYIL